MIAECGLRKMLLFHHIYPCFLLVQALFIMANANYLSPQSQLRAFDATKDQKILTELFCALRPDLMALPLPPEMFANFILQQQNIHAMGMRAQCENAQTMLLERDGVVQASLTFGQQDQDLRLLELVVLPHAQRQGIAQMLLTHLQQQASAGDCAISLRVFHHNLAARALYEVSGFVVVGGDEISAEMQWRAPC